MGRVTRTSPPPLRPTNPLEGPTPSGGDKHHKADGKKKAADAFNGDPPSGLPSGLTRPTSTAVDFVDRFNAQLGLSADAVKAKNKHMGGAPTQFFTAMPALFYADVRGPFSASSQLRATPSPVTLLIGDAHLGNLMTRPGAEGKTGWGWSDCDKSGRGSMEWDLERLATDTVLAARESKKDFSKSDQAELVAALSEGYTQTLRDFAKSGQKPTAYLSAHETDGELHDFIKAASDNSQKKLVDDKTKKHGFPASQQATAAQETAIRAGVASWASRLPADAPVARPVQVLAVGVDSGSVGGSNSGLVKYLAMVAPANPKDPPVLLKFKQVLPSAVENGTGNLAASDAARAAKNTATLEGGASPLLGYATVAGRSCLVDALDATSDILDPEKLGKKDFKSLASAAGVALARSHLQTGDVSTSELHRWLGDPSTDAAAVERLTRFATSYADQTEADTKSLRQR